MSTVAHLHNTATKLQQSSNSGIAGLLLHRKCACGSPTSSMTGECEECRSKKVVQTKLTIGASNDSLKQEADRVADQVMSMPVHSTVTNAPLRIQRFTGQFSGDNGIVAPPSVDRVLASPGRPLEPRLRQNMEQRFGHDFSQVRVHTGASSEKSAREVNANAYTVGRDIVFANGQYSPDTVKGRRLLAHEIVHVIQQTIPNGSVSSSDHEFEANNLSERFIDSGSRLVPLRAAVPQPQYEKSTDYPKTATIENAEVRVASKKEEDEVKKIITDIKLRFGISFASNKGLQELKNSIAGDPEESPTMSEFLSNPSAPKKKVKDVVATSVWTLDQLRDLQKGLAYFGQVLGLGRLTSNAPASLTTVSRLNVGLNDAKTATDKNILGQYFTVAGNAVFYDSAGSSTELKDKKKAFLGTVVHEVAHSTLGAQKSLFVSGLSPAYWKDENTPSQDQNAEKPVTSYGGKNAGEDLAEAVEFYFLEQSTLQQKCPQRFAIIDKLIKNWNFPGPSPKP